jgi:hypothetical protein
VDLLADVFVGQGDSEVWILLAVVM